MPEAGASAKSPKTTTTTRRLRSGPEHAAAASGTPRQVHFEEQRTGSSGNGNPGVNKVSGQPTSSPAVGAAPGVTVSGIPGGQWYTSTDPSRSISQPAAFTAPQHQQPSALFPGAANFVVPVYSHQQQPQHPSLHHKITYIGHRPDQPPQQHVHLSSPVMASYSNAGPPSTGVNFQPPVPDSTFGPMPHVYVPRFDAGGPFVQGVPLQSAQVGLSVSPVQFVPVAAAPAGLEMPASAAATFTVLLPKTYYLDGYTYHQPGGIPIGQQGYVMASQPGIPPQLVAQQPQPMVINGQAYYPVQAPPGLAPTAGGLPVPCGIPLMVNAAPALNGAVPVVPGVATASAPEVSGLGRTPNEEMIRQVEFAYQNKLFEPQDFKPSDDDPSRFYYCREQDGNWTQRSRYTLDRMAVRWYVTDEGWFYAVRLPD